CFVFFFSSRRRHTRWPRDWSSDVCSSDLLASLGELPEATALWTRRGGGVQVGLSEADELARLVPDPGGLMRGGVAGMAGRATSRSEERRVGKGGRWRGAAWGGKKSE